MTGSLGLAGDLPNICLMSDSSTEARPRGAFEPARLARLADASCRRILAAAGSRVVVAGVLVMALGWIASGPFTAIGHAREAPIRVDYIAFDAAASIVRQGDAARLYDADVQRSVQVDRVHGREDPPYFVYANPPALAAPFVPLTYLSVRAAYVVEVSLLAAIMVGVAVLAHLALADAPRLARAAAAIGIFGSTTTASALLSGQVTPVILLVALGCLLLHQRGRPVAAGAILGVLFIKPHLGLGAVAILFILGQRKLVLGGLSTLSLLAFGSWLMVGDAGMRGYAHLLYTAYAHPASLNVDVQTEQNLRGLLASIFDVYDGAYIAPLSAAIAVIAMGAAAVAARRAGYQGIDRGHYTAALAAAFTCLAAPHIQYYDLGLMMFPALFFVRRAAQMEPDARRYALGVTVLMVAWLEAAGLLAGVKASVSFPPLVVLMCVLVWWPTIERWMVRLKAVSPLLEVRAAA